MQGIKYHSPKRHKKSLKHARLLVLQRFYFLQTVKDGSISQIFRESTQIINKLQLVFWTKQPKSDILFVIFYSNERGTKL